jgi:hypothetical protein
MAELLPSPALGEGGHRSLARRLEAVYLLGFVPRLPSAKRCPEIMHDDVREFIRGVSLAFGLLILTTIIVLIASFIVSALF